MRVQEVIIMMEQVFFVVDGQELIMDKVLVEFDGSPVFFVCKNKNVYFIALNIDLNEERYILTRISLNRLSRMLHGKITMRESILKGDKYWDIVAGADVDKDIIYERNIEEIPLEVLPYEGAYFKIASKDMAAYTEKIDFILYGEDDWENEAVQECGSNHHAVSAQPGVLAHCTAGSGLRSITAI